MECSPIPHRPRGAYDSIITHFDPQEGLSVDLLSEQRLSATTILDPTLAGTQSLELELCGDVDTTSHEERCLFKSGTKGVKDKIVEEQLDFLDSSETYYLPWISEVFHPCAFILFSVS